MFRKIPIELRKEFNSSLRSLIIQKMTEKKLSSMNLSIELDYVKIYCGMNRIDKIINSKFLSLNEGGYDYRYITDEIIEALCKSLGIDDNICKDGILEIRNEIKRVKDIYDRFYGLIKIFPEKKYKVVGMSSAYRVSRTLFIKLPTDLAFSSLEDQKKEALNICRKHYIDNKGNLDKCFGKIIYYRYFYSKDDYLDFYATSLK